jgi:hypothetical protein
MIAIDYLCERLHDPDLRREAASSARTRAENIKRLAALYGETPRTKTSVATIRSLEIALGLDAFGAPVLPPPDIASGAPWHDYLAARFLGAAAPDANPQALIVLAAPGASSGAIIELLSQWFASQRGCVVISPDELVALCARPSVSNAEPAPQESLARELANDLLTRAVAARLNLLITTDAVDAQVAIALIRALETASIRSTVIALPASDYEKPSQFGDAVDLAFATAIRTLATGPHADALHVITPEGRRLSSICRSKPARATAIDSICALTQTCASLAPEITLPDGRTLAMRPAHPAPVQLQSVRSEQREPPPQLPPSSGDDIERRRRWKEKVARWAAQRSRNSS